MAEISAAVNASSGFTTTNRFAPLSVAALTVPEAGAEAVAATAAAEGETTVGLPQAIAEPPLRAPGSESQTPAPDGDPLFRHTIEGSDDMPAHVRTALTAVNLSVPVSGGHLALGTWQGIYLWEHRTEPHSRRVVVHLLGE